MSPIQPDDVFPPRFERSLRGYRTEHVDEFFDRLLFAWRAGTGTAQLQAMLDERRFPVAVRGYARSEVDRLLEQVASTWTAASSSSPGRVRASHPRTTTEAKRLMVNESRHEPHHLAGLTENNGGGTRGGQPSTPTADPAIATPSAAPAIVAPTMDLLAAPTDAADSQRIADRHAGSELIASGHLPSVQTAQAATRSAAPQDEDPLARLERECAEVLRQARETANTHIRRAIQRAERIIADAHEAQAAAGSVDVDRLLAEARTRRQEAEDLHRSVDETRRALVADLEAAKRHFDDPAHAHGTWVDHQVRS
jgi:DivIVA domain-containing protein